MSYSQVEPGGDQPKPELRARARAALRQTDAALESDCDIDAFIAGGPGGQHRNKTESAIRVTHRPTGVVVVASERRSQFQNRIMAMVRLREKLYVLSRVPKARVATRPSRGQKAKRLDEKHRESQQKRERRRRDDW